MTIEVKLPELGDGIESGDVLGILVSEGDVIAKDADIIELETDKATLAVPSSHAGKVLKVHVAVGQTTPIGATLLTLEEVATTATASAPQEISPQETASPEPIPEKPTPAAASSETPTPSETAPSETAPSETTPSETTPSEVPPTPTPQKDVAVPPSPSPQVSSPASNLIPAGPAVRRFAREVGVDLGRVPGSGESGRITRDDVLDVVRHANRKTTPPTSEPTTNPPVEESQPAKDETPPAEPPQTESPQEELPQEQLHLHIAPREGDVEQDQWGPVRIEKMSRVRKTIARKMHESWTAVPRVTNFDDADITELERIRQGSKADYAAAGVKLTSMPFVIKAVAQALLSNPELNATVDLERGEITYKQYVNIGLAVDTDRGLIVPVLRSASQLSVSEAARNLATLADRVRTNQFSLEDLQGGGFTISNLGAIGGVYSTPIVNAPEVAILLVGRARKAAVVVDDEIVVRLMMPLSLSYDHRLVDGGAAARFLNDVIALLETPSRLLLAP